MNKELGIKNRTTFTVLVICIAIVLNSLFFISLTEAAVFFFEPAEKSIGINGEVKISLFIDTEGQQINALEGVISVPLNIAKVIEVNDGGSIIDVWLEKPEITEEGIVFSGIISGGFGGVYEPYVPEQKPGKILSFILKSSNQGVAAIVLKRPLALLNDGDGTSANTSSKSFYLEVLNHEVVSFNEESPDTILPEEFFPEIAQDQNIFDGKYFVIFNTQDKDSGIDHYEISVDNKEWVIAESPYVLKDQSLRGIVKIKAVDKSGNERVVEIPATYPQVFQYKNYLWGIIILLGAYILFVMRKSIFNNIMKLWDNTSTH